MIGELRTMDHTGDTKVIWDTENADEVAAAKLHFDTLKKKGFMAYKVEGKKGEKGEVIREFDPNAGMIIMAPQLKGG